MQAKESILALKPRADVTRSPKQGYQCPHKKDLCPPNTIFKKNNILLARLEITHARLTSVIPAAAGM